MLDGSIPPVRSTDRAGLLGGAGDEEPLVPGPSAFSSVAQCRNVHPVGSLIRAAPSATTGLRPSSSRVQFSGRFMVGMATPTRDGRFEAGGQTRGTSCEGSCVAPGPSDMAGSDLSG